MGLAVEVGYLASLVGNDEEGAERFRNTMTRLNGFLVSSGHVSHQEPESCIGCSYDVYGYSGLHYLRRIAAHLDLRGALPPPGGPDASKDSVVEEYYQKPGILGRLLGRVPRARTHDHLMEHSDAEGFYLPQDFPAVLFPPEELQIPGAMVGSSIRLQGETKRLAAALQLPLDLDPDGEEIWQACDSQGTGDELWQRYGIESFVCLARMRRPNLPSGKDRQSFFVNVVARVGHYSNPLPIDV